MPEEIEEKKEFLEREEIRTMAKDLSRLREAEAQKERERIAALQLLVEKIKKAAEGEPRQRREEKIIPPGVPERPLEEKPVKESLIPKLLPKRPPSFQKVLVRGVMVFLCLLLISGLFYWVLGAKRPPIKEITPPRTGEEIPPKEEVAEKPEIIISPSLLSIAETKTLEISKNEEIPESFNRLMAEELQKGEFLRVVIKNIDENRLASLEDLFGAFQIEAPEGISKKLEADYTLAIYPQEQGKRIVFAAKIGEEKELAELLKNWEEKIVKEEFFVSGNKVPTLLSYFKTSSYQNVSFRYLTISKEDFGICYLLFDNYFVFATSFESLKKAIEQVKQEVELSVLREKVGQLFIVGFEGKEISSQLEEFIKKYKPGGVLLLSKNIESQEQLKNLISGLQEISLKETGLPLFIAVDQEGKSLARIGFLSEKTDQSEIKNADEAYQVGLKRGEELKELGVNLNLAPVLDIASSGDFLFDRSFQKSAGETGELAKSLISGQKTAGILTAMKHFPGYGGISSSPEEELGVLPKVPEISQFKKAAEANPEIVMTSNLIYQQIDSSLPFPLSAKAIRYLKDNLGQEILIVSDDLDQNSLLEKFSLKDILKKPVEAGVDILIFSGYRLPAEKGLDEALQAAQNKEISLEKIDKAFLRITQLKKASLK